jgi:hypothetical protein
MRTGTPNSTCAAESWRTWLVLVRTVWAGRGAQPQLAKTAKASSAHWQRAAGRGRLENPDRAFPLATARIK